MSETFWIKVDKRSTSECWPWLGAKKPTGYGNVRINKVYKGAHRVSWELSSPISNRVDMVRKGRANYHHHQNRRRGLENANGKLSDEQVSQIRTLYIPGVTKQADIAASFGVSQRLVSLIVRGEARKNG